MKKSARNAVTPNLNAVYEQDDEDTGNKIVEGSIDAYQDEHESCSEERIKSSLETSLDMSTCRAVTCMPFDCENIDEAMQSLYSLPADLHSDVFARDDKVRNDAYMPTMGNPSQGSGTDPIAISHPYDWILDGDPIEQEDYNDPEYISIQHEGKEVEIEYNAYQNHEVTEIEMDLKLDGGSSGETDGELTCALAGMELEICSSTSSDLDTAQMMDGFLHLLTNSTSHDASRISSPTNFSSDENEMVHVEEQAIAVSSSREEFQCDNDSTDTEDKTRLPHPNDSGTTPTVKWSSIPDFLPFEDPSTPAGSFVRRLQVENELATSNDANIGDTSDIDLPLEYCKEGHDAFLKILESVPWEDNNDDLTMERDEYLIETLSSLDELSQNVTDSLLHRIKQKDVEIQQVLKQVQNVDIDITSSLSCTKQANSYLQRVRGRDDGYGSSRGGVFGGSYVLQESDRRDKLRKVDSLLNSIEELVTMEASVFDFVDDFVNNLLSDGDGLATFLETCESLKNRLLRDESFLTLKCLDESRERVSHIMEYSCQRIEEELMIFLYRRCKMRDDLHANKKNWDEKGMAEYDALFDARVVFDNYRMQEARKNEEQESDDECPQNSFAFVWSSSATKALCFEADRCLPQALLDPTPRNGIQDESPSEFDTNLIEIKLKIDEIQLFNEESASLRSLTMNLISIRLEFDNKEPNLVGMCHKLCSSLANVLHAHYTISEWHKEQIDDNCSTSTEIRCESPVQEDEETDNVEVERIDVMNKDDNTKSTSSSNCSRSSGSSNHVQAQISKCENFPSIPQCISGPQNSEIEDSYADSTTKKAIGIREYFLDSRHQIWQHCKGVLVTFLKTVIIFYAKKEQSNWSLTWMQDLESFHDIFELCNQMITLGRQFVGTHDAQSIVPLHEHSDSSCELKDSLSELFQKFVAGAHVEAMTEIGTMMASETWDLLPIPVGKETQKDPQIKIQDSIEAFLVGIGKSISGGPSRNSSPSFWQNQFVQHKEGTLFSLLDEGINPFTTIEERSSTSNDYRNAPISNSIGRDQTLDTCAHKHSLYEKVASYVSPNEDELALGTKTALNGLARWTLRLLNIRSKLPIIGDQVAVVLCNIYDLYFLTVFRLCIGNAGSEAIVLGNNKRSDDTFNQRFPKDLPSCQAPLAKAGANPYNHRRRSAHKEHSQAKSGRLLSILLSKYCEADINAPIKSEDVDVSRLRNFIHRGQAALSSMVSLDNIENWSLCHDGTSKKDADLYSAKCLESLIGASSSCLLVACIFDTAIQSALPNDYLHSQTSCPLSKYLEQMMGAISCMHTLSLRMCGTRAILSRSVVSNVSILWRLI